MSDIIQLLPDSVANQIAAGEVIQRPASAVKELMENAVDAGSTHIRLIVKDAGRTLIQVTDNGCGMSETDARMSFERHATSKIRKAEDLFAIRTMGFRGEALASIAAIAHVELKTRRMEDELGTRILVEGSEVKLQEPCSCPPGTSFSIKNLFYNVPARRNFLKSNPVEMKHILEEFQRVALANHGLAFSLHHNDTEVFMLREGNLAQRIVGIFGNSYKEQLIQVEESTSILSLKGFAGKPEFARKTRGEQYFFINNRFAKDPYLNHAVQTAYEEMLPEGSFAFYTLFIDIDPSHIDINIHPTKTEIKFDDEKAVYAIVKSAVKRALARYNIVPTLDFDQETIFNIPLSKMRETPVLPSIQVNKDYNPFAAGGSGKESSRSTHMPRPQGEGRKERYWSKLYEGLEEAAGRPSPVQQSLTQENADEEVEKDKPLFQLHNRYIVTTLKSGMVIIDQNLAHQRILYEKCLEAMSSHPAASQQELFPQTVEFSSADFELVKELEPEIVALGFDIAVFGKQAYVINGVPADHLHAGSRSALEQLIEQYKTNAAGLKLDRRENLARSMARNASVKHGKVLSPGEMSNLINELFACRNPNTCPAGNPTLTVLTLEELSKKFEK
jgi:DNA mismatch repair protein MutL